jgi:hypothetical protein
MGGWARYLSGHLGRQLNGLNAISGAFQRLAGDLFSGAAQLSGIQVHPMDHVEQLLPEHLVANSFRRAHHGNCGSLIVAGHLVERFAEVSYRAAHKRALLNLCVHCRAGIFPFDFSLSIAACRLLDRRAAWQPRVPAVGQLH